MSSKSRKRFDEHFEDIEMLVDIGNALKSLDEDDGGNSEEEIDVLYRSSVVFMVSHWEAYIEDICAEALATIVREAKAPSDLPKELRKHICKDIKSAQNELEMWELAGSGWKDYVNNRLEEKTEQRNRNFNTPKAGPTCNFFDETIGLKNISDSWKWDGVTSVEALERLNSLVAIRGQIAHRGKLDHELNKEWILDQIKFLKKLVSKTGGRVNTYVKKAVKCGLWEKSG